MINSKDKVENNASVSSSTDLHNMAVEQPIERTITFAETSSEGSVEKLKATPEQDSMSIGTEAAPADRFLPWTMSVKMVAEVLKTDIDKGLNEEQAKQLKSEHGPNQLEAGGGVSIWKSIVSQTANAMVLVLIMTAIISLAITDWISGGVICGVVVINIVVGVFQEFSAQKTMDSLRNMSSPTARVIRDGSDNTIASSELVPGDIVVVKVGDTVPADLRLIQGMNFETEEALLTGESLPISKEYDVIHKVASPVGDRTNMAFASSTVSKGRACGIVVFTGMNTEIGEIARSLKGEKSKVRKVKRDEDGNAKKIDYVKAFVLTVNDFVGAFLGLNEGTPLHRLMARLAIGLFFIAVIIAIVAMAAQKMHVTREVGVYAIVVALAMIPASMTVVLTITMAMGTKAMAERHVVVRKLDSLEALGAVNDICSDKTGTLTQGKMVLRKAWIPSYSTFSVDNTVAPFDPTVGTVTDDDGNVLEKIPDTDRVKRMLYTMSLANIAHIVQVDGAWRANGDPTEVSIHVFVSRFGWERQNWASDSDGDDGQLPLIHLAEYPFDSTIKRMTAVYKERDTGVINIFTKGATERILALCTTWFGTEVGNDKEIPFTEEDKQIVYKKVDDLAEMGLRVLSFASRKIQPDDDEAETAWKTVERDSVERGLCFHGLAGIYDPPRPESAPAVSTAHKAGINVHMLTGDHPSTATAIAKEVGILPADLSNYAPDVVAAMVMPAPKFDALSDREIDDLPCLPLVIARCSPQTKVRMIDALHRRKAFTAMTGDGVNDSPSLKKSDVGIAMGLAGSDVAKDASDIVLSDDNFASILNAVEEGRRMTANIQKFVLHLLAGNVSQVIFLLLGLAFKDVDGFSVFPMSPVEVLWIIMITSSFPAMGLGFERAEPDIMAKPPQDPKSAVFTWEVIIDMLVYGLWLAIICVVTFSSLIYGYGDGQARLGTSCNEKWHEGCEAVFRARAVTFTQMTWCLLILAWVMIDMRRSMFRLTPDCDNKFTQFFKDIWRNQFLFWSVVLGALSVFPVIYIPVINDYVFKHKPMTWEWAVAFAGLVVFVAFVEGWKALKRVYYRHNFKAYAARNPEDALQGNHFSRYNSMYSGVTKQDV